MCVFASVVGPNVCVRPRLRMCACNGLLQAPLPPGYLEVRDIGGALRHPFNLGSLEISLSLKRKAIVVWILCATRSPVSSFGPAIRPGTSWDR